MWMLNGQVIPPDAPFTSGRTQYPANWLTHSTQAERDLLGVVWVDAQPRPDDRFYYVVDNGDGTYTATPKDLAECKAHMIEEVNRHTHSMLAPTDWCVTRRLEIGTPVPPEIDAYRVALRQFSDTSVEAINAAATLDQLAQIVLVWPTMDAVKAKGKK